MILNFLERIDSTSAYVYICGFETHFPSILWFTFKMKNFIVTFFTILIFTLFIVLGVLLLTPESKKIVEPEKLNIVKIQYSKMLQTNQIEENHICKDYEDIGDEFCHDHLNVALCDYDHGDCCTPHLKSLNTCTRCLCHKAGIVPCLSKNRYISSIPKSGIVIEFTLLDG